MSVQRIESGVLLTGHAIDAVLYAVQVAERARARNGQPPSIALARLREAVSPNGQADADTQGDDETGVDETVTVAQAASMLGISPRHARRLAPLLGGRQRGGRWLLDRQAVYEHLQGGIDT